MSDNKWIYYIATLVSPDWNCAYEATSIVIEVLLRPTSLSRWIQTVIMMGFFVFLQALCEFLIHCNKRHIFLCLFFVFTITGRNEAIIVELKT